MKDALHGEPQVLVVAVDCSWVLSSMGGGEFLSSGQQRFDGFVAKNDESGNRPEAVGERLVAAGVTDPANDVLAAKLFEIID